MGLFVSTVSVNVSIYELGILLPHPTTDFDIGAQFTGADVARAISLTAAINGGTLTWRRTAGGTTETAADYDPDYWNVASQETGGRREYRAATFEDLELGGNEPDDCAVNVISGGLVTSTTFYRTSSTLTSNRKALVTITYGTLTTAGLPITEVWQFFEANGTTVRRTVTLTNTWTSGSLTSTQQVVT